MLRWPVKLIGNYFKFTFIYSINKIIINGFVQGLAMYHISPACGIR